MEESLESLIFEDGEFQAGVARKCLSYLSSRQRTGYTSTGLYYSYHEADHPKGLITIAHGFSEGMYKYREFFYLLLNSGYSTLAYEHRGHGRSVRVMADANAVHIDSFDTYVDDLLSITEEIARPMAKGRPLYLFGHSMGGCVSALFAEQHPDIYSKVILSSPMLALKLKGPVKHLASPFAHFMCRIGRDQHTLSIFSDEEKFETGNTTSRERYDYCQGIRESNILLQMSQPTYSWAAAACDAMKTVMKERNKLTAPTLIFLAENDGLVDNKAIQHFAAGRENTELVLTKGTKHEILLSPKAVLVDYMTHVRSFLG